MIGATPTGLFMLANEQEIIIKSQIREKLLNLYGKTADRKNTLHSVPFFLRNDKPIYTAREVHTIINEILHDIEELYNLYGGNDEK